MIALLVFAGPTILSLTPIPGNLISAQLPAQAGKLSTQSTSLSWTGAVQVSGVELRDPQGAVLASVERVEIPGGLIGLAAGDLAPLQVRVEQPRVDLVLSPEGSNFDALLRALESTKPQVAEQNVGAASNSIRRPLNIQVIGAAARVTDALTGQQWLVDQVDLDLVDPGMGIDAIELTAKGTVAAVAIDGAVSAESGGFELRLGEAEQGGRLATINASGLPLSLAEPFLKRADPTAAMSGSASLNGSAAWRPHATALRSTKPADVLRALAAGGVRSSGALKLTEVEYRGMATQGGPVRLASIDGPWRFAAEAQGIAIQQLDLTSEVGRLTATGSISPEEVEQWQASVPLAPRDLSLAARVDLDRLATVAPQLVRLRADARLESGRVEASAVCRNGQIDCRLKTGALTGVAGDRRVAWREPLDMRLVVAQRAPTPAASAWILESLTATSTFFHATAAGNAERLEGNFDFDLDQLAQQLAPLVDLGDTQLAGQGQAVLTLLRDPATQTWRMSSKGAVDNLFVGSAGAPIAREPRLDFTARASGASGGQQLAAGTLSLTAGQDSLTATLPESNGGRSQPFNVRLTGDAARWLRRISVASPAVPRPEDLALAGQVELTAGGLVGAEGGTVDQFKASLSNLGIDTARRSTTAQRVRLSNERLEVSGRGAWDTQSQTLRIDTGQAVSSVASANLRDLVISLADPTESRGEAVFLADLAGVSAWLPPAEGRARYQASGRIEGMTRLRGVPEGIQLVVQANGNQLELVDRTPESGAPRVVWQEPALKLTTDLMVTPLADEQGQVASYSLDILDAKVEARSVSGSFGGRVADLMNARGVELGGGINYDLEQLTPILWPQLGESVRLVGRDRATFRIATDDSLPADAPPIARLRARVEAPWQSASLFGLQVGAGRLATTLQAGVAKIDPLDIAVGGGRLTAAPVVTFVPEPATLALGPGPVVNEVAVSQEVNERVLKFIAPVLADATRIDGRFSVSLRELAVPLVPPPAEGPRPGRAAGVLDVRQLRVFPGPAVSEWTSLIGQIVGLAKNGVQSASLSGERPLVTIDNNQIEFQLVDGRVYHRGLQFTVGDAVVQSSGSVGVDETLDIVLSVPILQEWVDKNPVLLGRLRGQALRIPIQGTFNKPKVNRDAFRELSGQVLQGAAAGAIEGGLNLLLEKLRSR